MRVSHGVHSPLPVRVLIIHHFRYTDPRDGDGHSKDTIWFRARSYPFLKLGIVGRSAHKLNSCSEPRHCLASSLIVYLGVLLLSILSHPILFYAERLLLPFVHVLYLFSSLSLAFHLVSFVLPVSARTFYNNRRKLSPHTTQAV